jgi:hypothetical protein
VTPEQGCIVLVQWQHTDSATASFTFGKGQRHEPLRMGNVLVLAAAAQLAGAKQEDHGQTSSSKLCVLTPMDNNEELWSFE